jgi:ribonucleoside-diphosphate reductase alpha chain
MLVTEPHLTANSEIVLAKRYLRRDADGQVVETPEQLFARVAGVIAAADRGYGADESQVRATAARFEELMVALDFLPNSPTLMNAGRELGQLAACFVVPVDDSTPGIFDAVRSAALIQKTGGGTGFAFSNLRPSGDFVASTGGMASGPIAFMQVFDVATEAVKQGGTRRGANMGVLRVDHPDILEFIALKLDSRKMRNFNLSVAITDEFMSAVADDRDYELVNPRTGQTIRKLSARKVWGLIANAAWTIGDPGLVFIDRINASHPARHLGPIQATNPCGEQPLLPFESCTLGSINLAHFHRDGEVDWQRLRQVISDAIHFLDNVIDVNAYPLPEIAKATRATRKIGLGVMGFADLLIELEIPYDSEPAVELAEAIADCLDRQSVEASAKLAESRGTFPAYQGSSWDQQGRPMRNATTTTVAPTGTISIIAGCSSGIEPLFAVAYQRNVLDGETLREVHPAFERMMRERDLWSDELAERLVARGRVRGMEGVPDDVAALFPTAHDIDPATHVRMQAAFQSKVHAAVSKTINLPSTASPEDVASAYQLAYDLGCKGVTVYRDRSRSEQVLEYGSAEAKDNPFAIASDPDGNCPECSSAIQIHSGCRVCHTCGWSACG